jgi:hypothetical protein
MTTSLVSPLGCFLDEIEDKRMIGALKDSCPNCGRQSYELKYAPAQIIEGDYRTGLLHFVCDCGKRWSRTAPKGE